MFCSSMLCTGLVKVPLVMNITTPFHHLCRTLAHYINHIQEAELLGFCLLYGRRIKLDSPLYTPLTGLRDATGKAKKIKRKQTIADVVFTVSLGIF